MTPSLLFKVSAPILPQTSSMIPSISEEMTAKVFSSYCDLMIHTVNKWQISRTLPNNTLKEDYWKSVSKINIIVGFLKYF